MTPRLRWLDLLRSAAVVGMIAYHIGFDLQFYYEWNVDVLSGTWKMFQVIIASLFLVISGISAGFWTRTNAYAKAWRRGWTILSFAMLVSLATAISDPEFWIRFGILHCIALSTFLLPPLRRVHPALIVLLGLVCIALGPLLYPPTFYTLDYVPPFPWLGPILLGFAIGIPLSERTPNESPVPRTHEGVLLDTLAWPGRHSLAIYLLHQPVILAVLWLAL